ncbi:MAG: hypothetical protein ACREQ7_21075 [Candidatus Binatia bacterium]
MIVEDILSWCLFPLVLAAAASFACAMYDSFLSRRRRVHNESTLTKIVPLSVSDRKRDRPATRQPVIRGYDSPELFRQDWWLIRIEQSRRQIAGFDTPIQILEPSVGTREEYEKRVCAVLAHHPGTKCDN